MTADVRALEPRRLLAATGAEFQVNTFTTDSQNTTFQSAQAIGMDATGNFVVVWQSDSQDGQNFGVYGQRFNAAGVAQGSEFQVNTYTTSAQERAVVAMDADGDFVVAWTSAGQDASGSGVYAQRYNAAGVAQGGEFLVNTHTTDNQFGPSIAMDTAGNFVITWTSNLQDGNGVGVYGQRFDAAGGAQGAEFLVATTTTDRQEASSVAMDADGDFVVAWSSNNQDGSQYGIYAQRFDEAGVKQGSEFLVNSFTTGTQWVPVVDLDADGDFVVTWFSQGQDGSGDGVYAQRYDTAGVAQGGEFRVNSYTTGAQQYARVAMEDNGDFIITWQSLNQDGSNYGVYAQRYTAAGAAMGAERLVNTFTTGNQRYSAVAMDADGDHVVAWASALQDGSSDGVYAQRFSSGATPTDLALPDNSIDENAAVGTAVGTFSPTDADSGDTFTYALIVGMGSTDNASFQIVGNELRSNAVFDFEADASYEIRVQVTDSDGLTFEKALTVAIADANEDPMMNGGTFTISENRPNGYVVGTVTGTDPDAGDSLTYAITAGNSGNAFAINSTTGQITVNSVAAVNFELNPTFSLTVEATDTGLSSDTATVTVSINDLNESPAAFGKSFSISENRPVGYVVGNITTSDQDAGQTLSYSITGGNTGNAFAINSMTGQITVNSVAPVNFEVNQTFNLQVTATDNGTPANSRVGTAVINLTNLNEQPFLNPQTFTLSENRPMNYFLGQVLSYDPDFAQSKSYSITAGNTGNAFSLDSETGSLRVNSVAAVNFETNPTFSLTVRVADSGTPQQSRSATITVNLTDLNEQPFLSDQTIGNIVENSPNGTVVGTVAGYDVDAGQSLSYAITGGNAGNAFTINAASGQVTVNNQAALDFETTPTFNLQIAVTDNGSPQQYRTATAVVNLIDQTEVMAAAFNSARTTSRLAAASTPSLSPTAIEEMFVADKPKADDGKDVVAESLDDYTFLLEAPLPSEEVLVASDE